MRYTLITAQGRIYQFYLLTVAEQFQVAYGGTLIDNSVVQMAETTV
jgi:hypothetical protein